MELTPGQILRVHRALFFHWQQRGALENALTVLEARPQIIDSELLGNLRELTRAADDFQRAASLLEQLFMENPALPLDLRRELALLYSDWGRSDLQRLQNEVALVHLRRGHELLPEYFPIARQLSDLYLQRGESKAAAETLDRFMAASKNAAEKETARQLLARIRPA
jgi:tetratricopeptide (TPR) repeat protein